MTEHTEKYETQETTTKIEANTEIHFLPEDWAKIKKVIDENRRTMHLILELGKVLAEHESLFWKTIHSIYPEAAKYNLNVDMMGGILYVLDPVDDARPQGEEGLPAPFALRFDGTSITPRHDPHGIEVQQVATMGLRDFVEMIRQASEGQKESD